jgi:hypothetical protein
MEEIIKKHLGYQGKMISGSKSGYGKAYPKNIAIFNANVCTNEKKIWWGDIDITVSKDELIALSQELKETIYVLYEMDGRFENERQPKLNNAAIIFEPDGTFKIGARMDDFYKINRNKEIVKR